MKTVLISLLLIIGINQAFGTQLQVDLITENGDDLENLVTIELLDSSGNQIAFKENQDQVSAVEFADSIQGKIRLRISAIGYFPIEIDFEKEPQTTSVRISNVLLVPSIRRRLPTHASCGTFAPRMKDIPKNIDIEINGLATTLVPDKKDVTDITYIRK